MITSLSARQYRMLNQFAKNFSVTLEEVKRLNQTTFGSLFHRNYVKWIESRKRFHITHKGMDALQEFKEIEILRKIQTAPVTHYFNEIFPEFKINEIKERKVR